MDDWNAWSWLAIPATAWAFAHMMRGLSGYQPAPRLRQGPPWWAPTRWEIRERKPESWAAPQGDD